ncbi:MAG: sigma 54-interacting transcriptional regulator [Myxococcales bacterium]|nr:sigma 54-interacting transcriptional regulator [Myxococcales bacterium]
MSGDTETLDLPGDRARRSLTPLDAGLVLLAAEGAEPPPIVRLSGGPLFIGRDPPAGGLRIAQGAVSKLHAQLLPTHDGVRVRDLDSRNGVVVSGRRVADVTLEHRDVVHIGNVLYLFVAEGLHLFERPPPHPAGFEATVAGPTLRATMADLAVVAPTDLAVLLLGETGSGKEVFARAVHAASGRRGRFVALNCAALPAALLEAELFGVRRGAFTGADRDRDGLFRAADRGTLFLDEIGEMPLEAQAKVLRCLATKEVLALGATEPVRSDARIVCATHRDLAQLCRDGRFRPDLLGRIRQHTTELPALRDRKEDVLPLLRAFLSREGRADLCPDFRATVLLVSYDWPFNVRELEAVARRAAALVKGSTLRESDLPPEIRAAAAGYGSKEAPAPVAASVTTAVAGGDAPGRGVTPTADELREMLVRHRGNVAALARHYAKDRAQLHRWFRRYQLVPEDFRDA